MQEIRKHLKMKRPYDMSDDRAAAAVVDDDDDVDEQSEEEESKPDISKRRCRCKKWEQSKPVWAQLLNILVSILYKRI